LIIVNYGSVESWSWVYFHRGTWLSMSQGNYSERLVLSGRFVSLCPVMHHYGTERRICNLITPHVDIPGAGTCLCSLT